MSTSAILATDLGRTFGKAHAVRDLSIDVPPGEVYGLLGPNGAGKSTTVRIFCSLLMPTAGRALVAGYDVAKRPQEVRLRIGAALQATAIDNLQTGRELLKLQARLYGIAPGPALKRIRELEDLVDIGEAMDKRISTYSGGMRRRLDIATALLHRPQVLFLDEPTTGLDPLSRQQMWDEVRRLNRELGMTILLTTQYLEEADNLADRLGIIADGRLVAEGKPDDLKRTVRDDVIVATVHGDVPGAEPRLRGVRHVDSMKVEGETIVARARDGASVIGPFAIAVQESGLELKSVALRTPTLDDVFLQITGARMEVQES